MLNPCHPTRVQLGLEIEGFERLVRLLLRQAK